MANELDTQFLHEIYRRIAAGDSTARDDLLWRAAARLEQLASHMLRNYPAVRRWEETGDVLQMAVLKLLRALDQVQPQTTREFVGLAAEQLRRVLIDLVRHYQGKHGIGKRTAGAISVGDDADPQTIDPNASHEPSADELESWRQFHEAVEDLPVMEREVFMLGYYHGWKQAETAALFQITERSVRRYWQSACTLLRERLGNEPPID